MGFKNGAYAKVWSVEPGESGKYVKARISVSRRKQDGSGYDQEFSGFVTMIGDANTFARNSLHDGDRIKLGGTDVTTRYDKNTGKEYVNYLVFGFEKMVDTHNQESASVDANPVESVEEAPAPEASTDLPF